MTNQTKEQFDPQVVSMVRAIKMQESSNNYNAPPEKAGVSLGGAYQYQKPTWQQYAKEILGDSNAQFTPENQDRVTYGMVKKWKDQGLQPGDIAKNWNPGDPSYPQKVVSHLKKIAQKQKDTYNPKPYSEPSGAPIIDISGLAEVTDKKEEVKPPEGLGQKLLGRTQEAGEAIKKGISGEMKAPLISAPLQVVGAGAGALGDVVGEALNLIPGVKQLEKLLGKGVEKLANTETGKNVVRSIANFSSEHPEISDNIGAGFNIVTAIPILKGLALVKNIAVDSVAQPLKRIASNSIKKELHVTLSKTVGGRKALKEVPEAVGVLIEKRAIPTIVKEGDIFRYDASEARKIMGKAIDDIDKLELDPLLRGTKEKVYSQAVRNTASKMARDNLSDERSVKILLDRVVNKYGKVIPLDELNAAKRKVYQKISQSAFGDPDLSNWRVVGKSIKEVIDSRTKGLSDEINKRMGDLIKAQDLLTYIEGKTIKPGGLLGTTDRLIPPLVKQALPPLVTSPLKSFSKEGVMRGILDRTAPLYKKTIKRPGTIKGLLMGAGASKIQKGSSPQSK